MLALRRLKVRINLRFFNRLLQSVGWVNFVKITQIEMIIVLLYYQTEYVVEHGGEK